MGEGATDDARVVRLPRPFQASFPKTLLGQFSARAFCILLIVFSDGLCLFVVLLVLFCCTFGVLLVLFWCTFGVVLVYFWCCFGVVLVYFWCCFGVPLVYFWCTFGRLWRCGSRRRKRIGRTR